MSIDDTHLLRALLREDLVSFYHKVFTSLHAEPYLPNWHIELLADKLTQCAEGKIKRLIICVPPRSGKSLLASVAYTAWLMGKYPQKKIITVSYAQKLASEFCRQQINVMHQPWFKEVFPGASINPRKCTEEEFETLEGGMRIATSTQGTLTGRGGDIIILDDIIKPQDALSDTIRGNTNKWVEHTLLSRLNDKINGVIIVIMQRVHHDDFVAHLMEKGGWDMVSLPAIAVTDEEYHLSSGKIIGRRKGEALHPSREPLTVLHELERTMLPFNFNTQYQQMPMAPDGNLVKLSWFPRYIHRPADQGGHIYQSWDTAAKEGELNDYSVCITWLYVDGTHYIIDVFRERLAFPDLRDAVLRQRRKWRLGDAVPMVLMEDSSAGIGLIQDLRRQGLHIKAVKVQGAKLERLHRCALTLHAGHVHLPQQALWLKDFENELAAFPHGRHDDQVDALSLFLNWHASRPKIGTGTAVGLTH